MAEVEVFWPANSAALTTLVRQTPMFLQVWPNIVPLAGALNYRRAIRLRPMIFEEEGEDEHHNEEHGHFYYPVPVALPFKRAPVGGSSRMNDLVNSVPVSYIRFHPDMTVGVEVTIVAIPIAHACGQGIDSFRAYQNRTEPPNGPHRVTFKQSAGNSVMAGILPGIPPEENTQASPWVETASLPLFPNRSDVTALGQNYCVQSDMIGAGIINDTCALVGIDGGSARGTRGVTMEEVGTFDQHPVQAASNEIQVARLAPTMVPANIHIHPNPARLGAWLCLGFLRLATIISLPNSRRTPSQSHIPNRPQGMDLYSLKLSLPVTQSDSRNSGRYDTWKDAWTIEYDHELKDPESQGG
ncbi:hypothetical protein FA13DRAFT_1704344 [Coprinellus micaceus]|uniref:Uncharacterized protein n=1 Tax=Coprinellus micaceus TaxID=71717 RepID=A0A4Y7TX46_COPMI|nr:hypothetical protein FA13DRAFT_1704344 [Coprinellus micaceus]